MKLNCSLLLLAVSLAVARAADTPAGIRIDADGGAVFIPTNGAMLIVITNNVRATEGKTLLTCDSLSILTRASSGTNTQTFASLPQTSSFGSDLQSITAEGNVIIKDEQEGRAMGDKAVFDQATDTLTLTGGASGPRLESADGKSRLSASKAIIFDRKTGVIRCEGAFHAEGSGPLNLLSLPGTTPRK
jgi:lipopolysaccharide export system protein LptA